MGPSMSDDSDLFQNVLKLKNPLLPSPPQQKEITFSCFLTSNKEVFFLYFCAHNFNYKPAVACITVIQTGKTSFSQDNKSPSPPLQPRYSRNKFTTQEN